MRYITKYINSQVKQRAILPLLIFNSSARISIVIKVKFTPMVDRWVMRNNDNLVN